MQRAAEDKQHSSLIEKISATAGIAESIAKLPFADNPKVLDKIEKLYKAQEEILAEILRITPSELSSSTQVMIADCLKTQHKQIGKLCKHLLVGNFETAKKLSQALEVINILNLDDPAKLQATIKVIQDNEILSLIRATQEQIKNDPRELIAASFEKRLAADQKQCGIIETDCKEVRTLLTPVILGHSKDYEFPAPAWEKLNIPLEALLKNVTVTTLNGQTITGTPLQIALSAQDVRMSIDKNDGIANFIIELLNTYVKKRELSPDAITKQTEVFFSKESQMKEEERYQKDVVALEVLSETLDSSNDADKIAEAVLACHQYFDGQYKSELPLGMKQFNSKTLLKALEIAYEKSEKWGSLKTDVFFSGLINYLQLFLSPHHLIVLNSIQFFFDNVDSVVRRAWYRDVEKMSFLNKYAQLHPPRHIGHEFLNDELPDNDPLDAKPEVTEIAKLKKFIECIDQRLLAIKEGLPLPLEFKAAFSGKLKQDDYLVRPLKKDINVVSCSLQGLRYEQQDMLASAFLPSFSALDHTTRKDILSETFTKMHKSCSETHSGSTANVTIAWMEKNQDSKADTNLTIYNGNLGDSLSFLVTINELGVSECIALSKSHKKALAFEAFGVFSAIALDHAIGDTDFDKVGMKHNADISVHESKHSTTKRVFVITASDGLEMIKPTSISKIMADYNKDLEQAAIALMYEALKESADNCSLSIAEVVVGQPPISIAVFDGHGVKGGDVATMLRDNFYETLQKQICPKSPKAPEPPKTPEPPKAPSLQTYSTFKPKKEGAKLSSSPSAVQPDSPGM